MTNPVTPNIGLNKIDRTSPATTYFDLEKYIDQNADTVDRFAGEASQAIEALQQRLDTEERREVVLQPGLQIVSAERSAPFSLSGIKGRTLVNLAGRQTNRSVNNTATTTISVGLGSTGNNTDTVNVEVKNTGEGYIVYGNVSGGPFTAYAGKYYAIFADVRINSISGNGLIKIGGSGSPSVGAAAADKTKIGVWQRVSFGFTLTSDSAFDILVGTCYAGAVLATANFDVKNISLYEISKSDFDELSSLSESQRNIKYPYVDSVQPVCNPYAMRYGENLLPPFYEATYRTKESNIISPYTYEQTAESTDPWTRLPVTVLPHTDYCLSFSSLKGKGKLAVFSADEQTLLLSYGQGVRTFNSGNLSQIVVYINGTLDCVDTILNPMLNIGKTAKPFKPREDSMLGLQTDLYSDPATGANADEMFEKDGQYFKMAKWKKVVLDGSLSWTIGPSSAAGYKQLQVTSFPGNAVPGSGIVTKFNGKIIPQGSTVASPDVNAISSDGNFYISISNTDSGWGDGYTPTSDEIKAYFMGWVMRQDGTVDQPYTSGIKFWRQKLDNSNPTSVLPTTPVPTWTPYQLVYQLSTPTVEPIVSEGMLTFNQGNNQVEVGTGIVLRESVKPTTDTAYWYINTDPSIYPAGGDSRLKSKAAEILSIYADGRRDERWIIDNSNEASNSFGIARAYVLGSFGVYSSSIAYSATYLTLDKSPVVPFVGSYAVNEKAVLHELSDAVQQNTSAVSVLMNKKADKDTSIPYLIKPTLLNGWQDYLDGYHPVRYYKDLLGIVHLTGLVKGGAVISHIFKLIDGYRPNSTVIFPTHASTNSTIRIDIFKDGHVYFNYQGQWESTSWVSLDGISFLAEQ